jgi:hypothetical protein
MWIGLARKPLGRCLIPLTGFAEPAGRKGFKGVNYGSYGNYGNVGNYGNPGNYGSMGLPGGYRDVDLG